jgi:hypothetical protein
VDDFNCGRGGREPTDRVLHWSWNSLRPGGPFVGNAAIIQASRFFCAASSVLITASQASSI